MTDTSDAETKRLDEFEQDLRKHPAFATCVEDMEDSLGFKALQALKYESENPNVNAASYKEEGNYYMERKEFQKAVTAYGGGISAKPTDTKLLAVLYTNRGIAHSMMRNYGSCVRDCKTAIKLESTHMKAYVQAAKALLLLSKFEEVIQMCDAGLEKCPEHGVLTDLKIKASSSKTKMEATNVAKEAEKKKSGLQLVDVIKQLTSRGITVNVELPPVGLPDAAGVQISFDHLNNIHWPVLIMYPEFGQTDFVPDIAEYVSVQHCLKQLLSPSDPPPWDVQKHYSTSMDALEVYFEDCIFDKQMVKVSLKSTLTDISKTKGFSVRRDLVMVLMIVSKLSKNFYNKWLESLKG